MPTWLIVIFVILAVVATVVLLFGSTIQAKYLGVFDEDERLNREEDAKQD